MDYPVYQGSVFQGYMDEEDCRDMLREANAAGGRRDVRVCRRGAVVRIVVQTDARITKTTAMRDARGNALSTTQVEDVYWGFRRDHTDGPARHVTVVKRPGESHGKDCLGRELFGFVNWKETDRFPRRRFNPDKITPLFASEAQMRAMRASAGITGA